MVMPEVAIKRLALVRLKLLVDVVFESSVHTPVAESKVTMLNGEVPGSMVSPVSVELNLTVPEGREIKPPAWMFQEPPTVTVISVDVAFPLASVKVPAIVM